MAERVDNRGPAWSEKLKYWKDTAGRGLEAGAGGNRWKAIKPEGVDEQEEKQRRGGGRI